MKYPRLLAGLLCLPTGAMALDFQFNNGVNIELDSTVTYGAQWRVESRDKDLLSDRFLADLQENPLLPLVSYSSQPGTL